MAGENSAIADWCQKARALLGSKKTGAARAVSGKNVRKLAKDFSVVEGLLGKLRTFSSWQDEVKDFDDRYGALVVQLEKSKGGDETMAVDTALGELHDEVQEAITTALSELPDDDTLALLPKLAKFARFTHQVKIFQLRHAELGRQIDSAKNVAQKNSLGIELRDLNTQVRQSLEIAQTTASRWLTDLASIASLDPRDAVLRLKRIQKEIQGYRADADPEWAKEMSGLLVRIEREREAVRQRIEVQKQEKAAEWTELCRDAETKALKGGKLLEVIARIRSEMAELKAQCVACELAPVGIDDSAPVARLDTLYENGFPKRTPGATPIPTPAVEGAAPQLENAQTAMALLTSPEIGRNWFTLKKRFKAGAVTEAQMKQAWALRQKILDDYMATPVTSTYGLVKGKTWMAPGSTNLESDIDVSILDHFWEGEGDERRIAKTDAQIVKEFNDWFLAKYKAQPGIMFDINLYASAKPRRPLPSQPSQQSPIEQAMTSVNNAGQDVGALMKMRRFMDWADFEDYQETVLAEMKTSGATDEDIATTRKQFETAEALYQTSLQASLDKLVELLGPKDDRTPEQEEALTKVREAQEKAKTLPLIDAQKLLLDTAHEIEHMQDVAMWVNNELYTKGIEEVRVLELEVDALAEAIKKGKLGPESGQAREMAGKIARLKELATETVFYANEAYHSEGPFLHIVDATQAVPSSLKATLGRDPTKQEIIDETRRRQDALSVHLCLQSFNEQAGDMMKDLAHYAGEDNPGIGFYRASKYLVRFMDALVLLQDKNVAIGDDLTPAVWSDKIKKTLLAARKGEMKFEGVAEKTQEELEIQAYAIEQMNDIMGVRTLAALGAKVRKIAAQVNANARRAIANEMRASKEQEKAYFGD